MAVRGKSNKSLKISFFDAGICQMLTFMLLISGQLKGQVVERHWSEGPLAWSEFKEEFSAKKEESLAYYLGYRQVREKRSDTVYVRLNTYAYLDKERAIVRPIDKVSPYLLYHQIIFDMAEYYRRTLQKDIDRAENIFQARAIFDDTYQDFSSDAKNFMRQTQNGEEYEILRNWRELVTDSLNVTPSFSSPSFFKRDFGIGMYGGLGTSIQTGSLSKQFTAPVWLTIGFDIGFRNFMLYLNSSLGGNRSLAPDFSGEDRFEQGSVGVAIIDLSLGYAVIDANKWKLVPFLGAGVTEYTPRSEEEEFDYRSLTSYNVLGGLVVDYKVRKRVKIIPASAREITDSSIRLKLFATPVTFDSDLTGISINIGVAYCGFARLIGVN